MTAKRKNFSRRFTLVELIVAMAVFALLATVVVQLFAASQKLWAKTEGKNSMYRDARMTLDLMSDLLTNIVHATTPEQGTQFFRLDNGNVKDSDGENDSFSNFSKLYFATRSNLDALSQDDRYQNPIRFVSFQVKYINSSDDPDQGRYCLVMRVLSDANSDFEKYFPPATASNADLMNKLDNDVDKKPEDQDEDVIRLLNNVVAFRVRLVRSDDLADVYKQTGTTEYAGTADSGSFLNDDLPYYLEITLGVMDLAKYDEYIERYKGDFGDGEAKEFRAQNAQIFRRHVYFGKYRADAFAD